MVAGFASESLAGFNRNSQTRRRRAGKIGFLFLACEDSSYMSGQVLHPNGGTIVNG